MHLTLLQCSLTCLANCSSDSYGCTSLQEHIEALYSYVEKLQESKADKENVAMEMNIKADKAALDSKVNVSTFDNSFSMLDEGLREALQKMDDYMNEEMALKQALKQLSVDMSEKMDGQAFQALRNYLGILGIGKLLTRGVQEGYDNRHVTKGRGQGISPNY